MTFPGKRNYRKRALAIAESLPLSSRRPIVMHGYVEWPDRSGERDLEMLAASVQASIQAGTGLKVLSLTLSTSEQEDLRAEEEKQASEDRGFRPSNWDRVIEQYLHKDVLIQVFLRSRTTSEFFAVVTDPDANGADRALTGIGSETSLSAIKQVAEDRAARIMWNLESNAHKWPSREADMQHRREAVDRAHRWAVKNRWARRMVASDLDAEVGSFRPRCYTTDFSSPDTDLPPSVLPAQTIKQHAPLRASDRLIELYMYQGIVIELYQQRRPSNGGVRFFGLAMNPAVRIVRGTLAGLWDTLEEARASVETRARRKALVMRRQAAASRDEPMPLETAPDPAAPPAHEDRRAKAEAREWAVRRGRPVPSR